MQQVHTATTRRLSHATSAHSDNQETESCNKRTQRRRARARRPDALQKLSRRPAALRKLSARETTGRATEAVGARDDRGDQPAE